MKVYHFELFLGTPEDPGLGSGDEFLDAVEGLLYEAFEGDVTPGVVCGVPILYCSMAADTPGEAIDAVWKKVVQMRLHPAQLRMQMNDLAFA